ncbi:MAG TPA: AI-2E family transporter [Candidatus Avelusimicrobium excrementipullorum]|nr:AI-2E family transporter [Candidatus Avelusimicrobium excrementipullorum]
MVDKTTWYYQKMSAICLTIIAAGVITAALVYTKALMIPLVIALFFYTILAQMAASLHRRLSFPAWLAMTVSILVLALCFAGIIYFTVNSVGGFIRGSEVYKENLLATTTDLLARISSHGIHVDQASIVEYIRSLPLFDWFKNFGHQLFSLVSNTTLIILFIIFLLLGSKKAVPTNVNPTVQEMLAQVSKYLSVKIVTSLATALLIWIVLMAFKVKLAFLFGMFFFLLNFIPSVGSIIAVLLPTPVLFLQYGFGANFFVVLGLMIALEFTIGNLIEPRFLGDGMDLHPVVVIASLIFWSLVWGVPGAFLSVPITASIKIVLGKIKHTRPVAELLAGRLPR